MFESHAFWNKLLHRPFYRAFFLNDFHYVGERICTLNGKDELEFNGRAYNRPSMPSQYMMISRWEYWVFYDIKRFEALGTDKPEWKKKAPFRPFVDKIEKMDDGTENVQREYVTWYENFDPLVIKKYVQSHTVSEMLKPKEEKWKEIISILTRKIPVFVNED
jgi:hypothetical protein